MLNKYEEIQRGAKMTGWRFALLSFLGILDFVNPIYFCQLQDNLSAQPADGEACAKLGMDGDGKI